MNTVRYEIDITFRCNLKCRFCNRMLDEISIPDSDITVNDIVKSGRILKNCDIAVDWLKLSGGEPLLHLGLVDIVSSVKKHWNPGRVTVHTNGTLGFGSKRHTISSLLNRRRFVSTSLPDEKKHTPFAWSPKDYGLSPKMGFVSECRTQLLCGRSFNSCGFSSCCFAPIIGRIIGINPHRKYPTLFTDPLICEHCPFTINKKHRIQIENDILSGKLEYPSPTYKLGISKHNEKPLIWPRFSEL